jgi:hypothetical protein
MKQLKLTEVKGLPEATWPVGTTTFWVLMIFINVDLFKKEKKV